MKTSTIEQVINREFGELVGKTVKQVRPLTEVEMEMFGWENNHSDIGFVIIFTDNTCMIPSSDPEGNSPGFAFVENMKVVKK